METRELIPVEILCNQYNIPVAFFNNLQEFELIQIVNKKSGYFIHISQIKQVEKLIRLHFDLEINFEGLDAIYHLLNQVETLKEEVKLLQNKLRFYEDF
jgi:cold shock CspA family protein